MSSYIHTEPRRIEPSTAQAPARADFLPALFDLAYGKALSECRLASEEYKSSPYTSAPDDVVQVLATEEKQEPEADPAVQRFNEILNRLNQFERLGRNWDSYEGAAPSHNAVAKARDLTWTIVSLYYGRTGTRAIPFSVVPLSGAGVQIEWRGPNKSIEVEVNADGAFGYLLTDNQQSEERDNVSEPSITKKIVAAIA